MRRQHSVYFIQSGQRGAIKIGIATDPVERRDGMQIGNPERLEIMATIPGDLALETRLHAHFGVGRIHGEWFRRETPGLLETVEHILRHGALPLLPEPEPVGWCCEVCSWPQESELGEHGLRECWRCVKDRLEGITNYSARLANSTHPENADLQVKGGLDAIL